MTDLTDGQIQVWVNPHDNKTVVGRSKKERRSKQKKLQLQPTTTVNIAADNLGARRLISQLKSLPRSVPLQKFNSDTKRIVFRDASVDLIQFQTLIVKNLPVTTEIDFDVSFSSDNLKCFLSLGQKGLTWFILGLEDISVGKGDWSVGDTGGRFLLCFWPLAMWRS